ncbi:ribonuclease domain-containing protein [Methanosphaera sp. ISO3-F5]|uniref:ribonuclease domain-containing protein n=1 Tax=Methanosphaera sp. ISO3-F5 TaxID=1452353 RepID=UPI002B2627CF|nr:ribonuclease domain-containing protein [Methanosphaera sp. ISO3-F5]WQH63533.1 ribonuclease domain-containing protein [Methanosphaera sp. ISO3-F5]
MDNKIISAIIIIIIALLGGLFGTGALSDSNNTDTTLNSTNNTTVIESGEYITADEVAAYIKQYHKLPSNYITKKEAQSLGWKGGPLKSYAPGKSIGGDVFTNRQGILPHIESKYIECDIDANGTSRGAKRIVYSTQDYKVYYTEDHYETFKEI